MKWQPNRRSQKKNSKEKMFSRQYLPKSILPILAGVTCFIGTGAFFYADALKSNKMFNPAPVATESPNINQTATNISIKILDEEFLGSGFLVKQTGDRYVVITNQHVLRAGEAPYKIQTPDGKIHSAKVIASSVTSEYEYDLAILEFSSQENYTLATIGNSFYLEIGESIYAAGFPYYNVETAISDRSQQSKSQTESITGLAIKTGRVALILNKALEEGYQIGYTNDVQKGMSGGPLLNRQGEVVGVNGKHAYPLWESPEFYQDGSQPCSALEKLIVQSSLAIPIEKAIELNPSLESIRPASDTKISTKSNLDNEDPEEVAKIQQKVEETNKICSKNRGVK